jgi:hypothetical protein
VLYELILPFFFALVAPLTNIIFKCVGNTVALLFFLLFFLSLFLSVDSGAVVTWRDGIMNF